MNETSEESFDELYLPISHLLNGPTHTYDPVGRCIYCMARRYSEDKDKLSREHIIPKSFGGKLILPQASCKACGDITGLVERRCAQDLYRPARAHLGLSGYRSDSLPKTLPHTRNVNGQWVTEEVDIKDCPFLFLMPQYDTAGLLLGRAPTSQLFNVKVRGHLGFPPGMVPDTAHGPDYSRIGQITSFVLGEFGRMIAKIAHSFAVTERGLGSFTPFLLPIILGTSDKSPHFVGSVQGEPEIFENDLHFIKLFERSTRRRRYLVVHIKLFGPSCFPVYEVVAGEIPCKNRSTNARK